MVDLYSYYNVIPGKVITKKVKKLPNAIPGLTINTYSSANIDGKIQNCPSCSDSVEANAQTKREIKAAMENMVKNMKKVQFHPHDLGQQITDFAVNHLAKEGTIPVSLNKIQQPQTVTQNALPNQLAPPQMKMSEPSLNKPLPMMSKPPTSETSAPEPLSSAAKPVPPPYLPQTGTPSFPMSLSMSRSLGSISSVAANPTGAPTPNGVATSNKLPSSGAANTLQDLASTNTPQIQHNPASARPMVSGFSVKSSAVSANPPPDSANAPLTSANPPPGSANAPAGSDNPSPGSVNPAAAIANPSKSPASLEPPPASYPPPASNPPYPLSNPVPTTNKQPGGKSIGKFSSVSDGKSFGKSPSSSSSSSSIHGKALQRNVKPSVDGPSDSSASSSSSSAKPLQHYLKPSIGSMLSSTRPSRIIRRHSIGSMLSSPVSTHSSTLNTHHIHR